MTYIATRIIAGYFVISILQLVGTATFTAATAMASTTTSNDKSIDWVASAMWKQESEAIAKSVQWRNKGWSEVEISVYK